MSGAHRGTASKKTSFGKQLLAVEVRLLESHMLRHTPNPGEQAQDIAKRLTEGYANHGFCINLEEAKSIGLVAEELQGEQLKIAWRIHRLNSQRVAILKKQHEEEIKQKIRDLPAGILEKLPPELRQQPIAEGDHDAIQR